MIVEIEASEVFNSLCCFSDHFNIPLDMLCPFYLNDDGELDEDCWEDDPLSLDEILFMYYDSLTMEEDSFELTNNEDSEFEYDNVGYLPDERTFCGG